MPALELEVAPLSAPEQRIFLYEKAKELKIPTALLPKPKVEEILNGAGGHPSAIMQLLEDTMTDRRPKKRQAELPVKKIAIVLALVAGGLLALSYLPLFDNAGQDPPRHRPRDGVARSRLKRSCERRCGERALSTQTSSGATAIPVRESGCPRLAVRCQALAQEGRERDGHHGVNQL